MLNNRLSLAAVLLLLALPAFADQTTYTAQINGTANCQSIVLNLAQQVTPGGTTTTLFYVLKECAAGETTPTVVVGQGNAAIPASAFSFQRQQTTLRVQTPPGAQGRQGTIDVTWRATTETQTTFSGVWTEQHGATTTRTTENQYHTTAQVSGTVVGWTAQGRQAWFGSIVQVGK